jgi:hypothetical protein
MNVRELTAGQFLAELFEFEYCEHCGGDVADHVAAPDMFGNWHAWCLREDAARPARGSS